MHHFVIFCLFLHVALLMVRMVCASAFVLADHLLFFYLLIFFYFFRLCSSSFYRLVFVTFAGFLSGSLYICFPSICKRQRISHHPHPPTLQPHSYTNLYILLSHPTPHPHPTFLLLTLPPPLHHHHYYPCIFMRISFLLLLSIFRVFTSGDSFWFTSLWQTVAIFDVHFFCISL